jgi:hypothetical protein
MKADPRLRTLFDYTLFHIGLYMTLISALFGLLVLSDKFPPVLQIVPYIKITVLCFVAAGIAAGAIASNIPEYDNLDRFLDDNPNLFGWRLSFRFAPRLRYRLLVHIEHGAFWAGLLIFTLGFLCLQLPPSPKTTWWTCCLRANGTR